MPPIHVAYLDRNDSKPKFNRRGFSKRGNQTQSTNSACHYCGKNGHWGRKGQNRASKGNGREPEPRGRTRGSRHWGPTYGVKTQTIHQFSSLHHSLRERTGEGPVSSVPAATAVGWDWWKKRLSNLPLARQHLGNRLALCYYP
ncbi:hypothetical protein AAFF_G00089080 [Aldrovandia affinis]|uniref:Uncharacterized protein n=1 Tax=Aldrovandia affinis TaxID=143900 RepID=A0AAD7RW39_9TELE|nr:hypothetical protein AAFF_G00089080 [Aldrovandia affinis]